MIKIGELEINLPMYGIPIKMRNIEIDIVELERFLNRVKEILDAEASRYARKSE